MIRVQGSLFRFHHDFLEADSRIIGSLDAPMWPTVPRSGEGSTGSKNCPRLAFRGREARVEFEWLRDSAFKPSRARFFLMEGSHEIARATVIAATRRAWSIESSSFSGLFERTNLFTHGSFSLTPTGGFGAEVLREITPFLALRRSHELMETKQADELLGPFLFFLGYNLSIA